MVLERGGAEAIDGDTFCPRDEAQAADGSIRVWVGQGVEPELSTAAVAHGLVTRLTASVLCLRHAPQLDFLGDAVDDLVRDGGDGLERAGPPTDVALLNRKTPPNGGDHAFTVRVFEDIVGDRLADEVAVGGEIGQSVGVIGDAVLYGVEKDQIAGVDRS